MFAVAVDGCTICLQLQLTVAVDGCTLCLHAVAVDYMFAVAVGTCTLALAFNTCI